MRVDLIMNEIERLRFVFGHYKVNILLADLDFYDQTPEEQHRLIEVMDITLTSEHGMTTRADQLRNGVNHEVDGKLYLFRCMNCDEVRGKENWAPAVSSGICAFCGWGSE